MRSTANRLLCTRLLCVACARHIKDDECPHRITQSILEDRYCQLQQPNNTAIWTELLNTLKSSERKTRCWPPLFDPVSHWTAKKAVMNAEYAPKSNAPSARPSRGELL